jgi:uncharacterized 2Fe-2S/4Fe-4S cluster protein (DUF4445 family)
MKPAAVSRTGDGVLHLAGVDPAANLAAVLAQAGFPLNTRCGMRGICRGCMVRLIDGTVADASGARFTSGMVRACQMHTADDRPLVIELPHQARIGDSPQVTGTFLLDVPCALNPSIPATANRDTGFVVDLGTTTVVVLLADLASGTILSRAGGFNAQIRFGDNVVTRISAGCTDATRREMRRALVVETLRPLLHEACRGAGRSPDRIAGGVIAGNTTMLHILADEDTSPLGVAPFRARFLAARRCRAAELSLDEAGLHPDAPVRFPPGFSAYLGADVVAGVHATGMTLDAAPSLLVDMGTNGEIVLSADGRLMACATAAGPAFEGAGLSCGTRAHAGAIGALHIHDGSIIAETIGGGPPARAIGICGSAYIDFLAEAVRQGWLAHNGRFNRAARLLPPAAWHASDEHGLSIHPAGSGGPGISEIDIAHLLQAKAAIGAGIEALLHHAGITAAAIGRVHLAGGFGMHVNVAHAIRIGLLPGFTPQQVRVVGNSALAGALAGLLDQAAFDEMDTLRTRVEILELNLQPGFEDRYIDHLCLP